MYYAQFDTFIMAKHRSRGEPVEATPAQAQFYLASGQLGSEPPVEATPVIEEETPVADEEPVVEEEETPRKGRRK